MLTITPATERGRAPSAATDSKSAARVLSIDALRGFDMFWIAGGAALLRGFLKWVLGGMPPWLAYQFEHPAWLGFSAWDLIMPLFLFIVGAAMPFSIGRRVEEGERRSAIYFKALRRVAVLWVLGMMVQGNLLKFKWDELRFFSNTLQAIAAGYLIATAALVHLRARGQIILTAALLATYALLLAWVPAPGRAEDAGAYTPEGNLGIWIDKALFGIHQDGTTYAWTLASLGFGATVLMGALGGHLLKGPLGGARKVQILVAAGVGCLLAGWLLGFVVPIIKHLWTSSMALWAGGWCYLLLALFHGVIDVLGWRRWSFPFVVIGANAIFAYMLFQLIDLKSISRLLFGGLAAHTGTAGDFVIAAGAFGILWMILWYLYRNRTFIRV